MSYERRTDRLDTAIDNLGYIDAIWNRLSPMQCAVVIHLMAGRDREEIEQHFELSKQAVSYHIRGIQRRLLDYDPKADPAKRRASLTRMSRTSKVV